jgi:hypothetical protein
MTQAQTLNNEADAVRVFVAAMVWGYGRVGYGPFRTARVLAENPSAPEILLEAAVRARRDGGPQAFAWLARNRLIWLGVAFATKYLYYCSGRSAGPALVLDSLVQGWLREHAGWSVRLDWHVPDYERYVQTVSSWAAVLGIAPAEVEYLMFSDAVAQKSGSQWADGSLGSDPSSPSMRAQLAVGLEEQAVLDALDEAAEAFAALPGGVSRDDIDDFERGVRELKRIVLARVFPPREANL